MKQTTSFAAIAAAIGRAALVAVALCVATAPSPSFADGTTLTWNGADGASWKGENWLAADGVTPSAWIDGANAVFPSAATVTLDGAVTVSNLTASGALTVNGATAASYPNFLTRNDALVFPGLKLADITAIDGTMAGGNFGAHPRVPAYAYHYTYSGTSGTAEFQCLYNADLRCVKIALSEEDDGVHVKGLYPTGYVPGYAAKGVGLGNDPDKMNGMLWNQAVATSDSSSGYGVCELHASTAGIRLVGEAAFGGTFSVSNVAMRVTAPIEQTWNQQVLFKNTTMTVVGDPSATIDTKYGLTGSETGATSAWLTSTASDTVFPNMVLSRTLPVRATLKGTAIGITENYTESLPYHIKFDGRTMTCQFQFHYSNYIKGVKVQFTQEGANVTAKWVMGYYHTDADGAVLGEDMENVRVTSKESRYTAYSVKNMTLRTPKWPSLTFGANATVGELIVDNAQLRMEGTGSSTYNVRHIFAKNGANVALGEGQNNSNSGEGCVRHFESGSTFFCLGALRTSARAKYVFDASCVYLPQDHWKQHDGNNYLCDVTFANGGLAVGNPLRCGYYNASNIIEWVSAGVTASTNAAGINLCYHNYNGDTAATNTVILRTDADLVITGKICDSVDWPGVRIVKRGAATLTLSGANTFGGSFTVEDGVVALGSDTALPASAPLALAGGSVTCGSTTNTTGVLTLSGDAAISLEGGALAFADSSGETWTPGATLAITGTDRLPTRSLRFGTSESGLTAAQLRQITYNGERVSLDSSGYLRHRGGFMLIVR